MHRNIDTRKLLQISLKYYIFITNNDWMLWKQISNDMQVPICVSATSTKVAQVQACRGYGYPWMDWSYPWISMGIVDIQDIQ